LPTESRTEADADGNGRICIPVVALVDTNILVYRFDPRDVRKQRIADELLRNGIATDSIRIGHQALIEFYAAVTRFINGYGILLDDDDAHREMEEMLVEYTVLYPDDALIRTALRGMAAYHMSWFDAHMWAYAESFGIPRLITEDFQHGRLYGSVQVINPFR
jgi:predicted nucleic acid-binding protein